MNNLDGKKENYGTKRWVLVKKAPLKFPCEGIERSWSVGRCQEARQKVRLVIGVKKLVV